MLPAPPAGFAGEVGLPPFQAHLLYNRRIRQRTQVEPFLAADERLLNDPALLPDIERAVARLTKALQSGELIGIFGDFDTDGLTGTALLTRALRDVGATVVPYVPDRVDEGHGLNDGAIRLLHHQGVSLLVTVDCGVASASEVALAASLGMDTIITDHHSLSAALPDACAIIDTKRPDSAYPYPDLTGVGMSFKLVEALYSGLGKERPDHLMELVALGTVADVGPLTDENRYLVKKGLELLNATSNPGIQALITIADLKLGTLDTESLAFGLIPRLNAPGRLDHSRTSLELLTATSLEAAEPLARDLDRMNVQRRQLTAQGVKEALRQVEAELGSAGGTMSIIIVESQDWIPGILGLIAGNLAEQFYRPAVALSVGQELSRASARSIPEFNMVDALTECRELFTRFGGHPQAAGFTMPSASLPLLKRSLRAIADARFHDVNLTPKIDIDCEVSPATLVGDNFRFIQSLSPFGEGNPAPVFLSRDTRVVEARQVGKSSQHLKLRLSHSDASWDAIAFGHGDRLHEARGTIDLVYTIGLNYWGDSPKIQLTVQDFRPGQ